LDYGQVEKSSRRRRILCSSTKCQSTECCEATTTTTTTMDLSCQVDKNCTDKFVFIGATAAEANFCEEGRCTANLVNHYLSSVATWHLAASLNGLAGGATLTHEYMAKSVKESGHEMSLEDMQSIQEATSASVRFGLSDSVHMESKQCVEELVTTFHDCPPGFFERLGGALTTVAGILGPGGSVASAVVATVGAVSGAFLPLLDGDDGCTEKEVTEKTMDCIVHGKTQTRTTEEQQEHSLAREMMVTQMEKLTHKVAAGETMTCSVTVPEGVSIYQLRLVTPAKRLPALGCAFSACPQMACRQIHLG